MPLKIPSINCDKESRESRASEKKGEIILSMLSLESHYASLSVSFFRSRKKRAGTKRLP